MDRKCVLSIPNLDRTSFCVLSVKITISDLIVESIPMEFIKKGKESFRLGLTSDEKQDYENALFHYQRGINQFLTAIRYVKRENFKVLNRKKCIFAFPNEKLPSEGQIDIKNKIIESAVSKCKMFLDRAEVIKEHLQKTKPDKYPPPKKPVEEEEKKEIMGKPSKPIKKKPMKEEDEEESVEKKMLRSSIEDAILKEKPNVKWSDVAGNLVAKKALEEAIILPRKYPQLFVGKRKPWKCVLLYGPPGTGKTYLAKALATRMDDEVNFFSVSSSSLVSKWLGESEKLVRTLFEMAIREAPSVIFIDEIDSLAGKREGGNESSNNESSRRMKTEFFVQIQKLIDSKSNVVLLAATNRPFDLDSAMRRRFEKRIYIPLPDLPARMGVLKVHAGKEIDISREQYEEFGKLLEGYSCSDISVCVRDALMQPVRKAMKCKRFKKVYDGTNEVVKIIPCYSKQDEMKKEGEARVQVFDMDLLAITAGEAHSLVLPRTSVEDLRVSIAKTPKSVNMEDLKGHEEFTEKFGQEG